MFCIKEKDLEIKNAYEKFFTDDFSNSDFSIEEKNKIRHELIRTIIINEDFELIPKFTHQNN